MEKSVLLEANDLVHGDRQADYGHPLDDFTKTAAMWSAILGTTVTAEQVGLCMCAVKISRQANRPKRDNLVDLAGYAETVQMVIEERYRRQTAAETFGPLPPSESPSKETATRSIITHTHGRPLVENLDKLAAVIGPVLRGESQA